jgi:hypothetical protein
MVMTHRAESLPGLRAEKKLPRRRRRTQPPEALLTKVRNLVVARRDSPDRDRTYVDWVTLEEISEAARARHGEVQKAFYQLVREGILTRAVNQAPHDSTRDPFLRNHPIPGISKRGRSGWQASRWLFRK